MILASSGRLLAQAVRHAGLRADVFDCFNDRDCRDLAGRSERLPWRAEDDPVPADQATRAAVDAWCAAHPGRPLLIGTGFEDRPALLADLAQRHPLCGTPPAGLAACKDPWNFAATCRRLGFATPALCQPGPDLPSTDWLARRAGGSGGSHLRLPQADDAACPDIVWQRLIPGEAVSMQFLAHPHGVQPLSVQRQFQAPAPGQPFRFGGLLRLAPEATQVAAPLLAAAGALVRAFDLRGLGSIDALWDGTTLWLLEVNPRPSASLGLLAPAQQAAAIRAHLATRASGPAGAHTPTDGSPRAPLEGWAQDADALNPAVAVVYACGLLSIPADFRFPSGCHDLPDVPCVLAAGQPVCTVQVNAGGIEKLRTRIGILRERLLPVAGADLLSSL